MKPKLTTLKNGLRILTIPMEDNPTVTVMAMVEAGSRYETKETNGLSHFLEHMCFKGTARRKSLDIMYELESLGAETNAFTGYDYTGYYAKGRANLFPKLLDVVADVYQHSIFPEGEIEKERGVIMGEIDMYEDMPQRKVHDVFAKSLYGNQPAGFSIAGPKENIKRFTRADFLKYHQTHYVASKTIIVVAGSFDHKMVLSEIKTAFTSIPLGRVSRKRTVSKEKGARILAEEKSTDQSHLVLGLRSIEADHKDMTALGVAIGILGQGMSSRLFTKLREEMGAGYYIRAGVNPSDDVSDITISTGTEPSRVIEVIAAIHDEIRKISTEPVSEAELTKQKEYMIGGLLMGLETSDAVAGYFVHQLLLGLPLKTPKETEREIRAVTAKDILRVSKKYLPLNQFHLALVGPHPDMSGLEQVMVKRR